MSTTSSPTSATPTRATTIPPSSPPPLPPSTVVPPPAPAPPAASTSASTANTPDKVPSSKRERESESNSEGSLVSPEDDDGRPRAAQRRRTDKINNKSSSRIAAVVDLVASSSTEEKVKGEEEEGEKQGPGGMKRDQTQEGEGGAQPPQPKQSQEQQQQQQQEKQQAQQPQQQQQQQQQQEKQQQEQKEQKPESKEQSISIPELITKRLWQLWSDDKRVVLATLTKLANICARLESQHGDPVIARTTKTEFHTLGGHAAVVGAMTRFCDSQPILAEGIRVLHNAAVGNADMKVSIGSLEGIKMIVDIMKLNSDHKSVQKNGCGALSILVYKNSRNAQRLVEHGGIPTIIKAMMTFPGNTWLQLWACNTLYALSNGDWKRPVQESGAEKIVAATFLKHYNNEDIQESARRLLKQIL